MNLRTLLAATMVLAMASAVQAEPFRLIVTHLEPPLVPNSVMDLAVELGYFEREGVDVELVRVQQTPSAIAAILSGDGDMANIGLDALLQLTARGNDTLKAVVSPNTSLPFLIASRDDIETAADLAGMRFGIGRPGSLDHALSASVLASQGADVDAVDLLALGQPEIRAQALAAGRIDATTISIGVWHSLPDKAGLKVLIAPDAYFAAAPVVNKVNVVNAATLLERRAEVAAVVRALIAISRDFADAPQLWVEGISPHYPDMTTTDLVTLATAFEGSWSVNGGMDPEALAFSADWLFATEAFEGLDAVELNEWADLTILEETLESVGFVDRPSGTND